jgi:hypothetical protein
MNTFVRDSSLNQIATPLSRRSSHTFQSDHRQTNAIGTRQSSMRHIACSSAPQSQDGDSTNPHLCIRCAHLPCSVRKRFNNTQLCRRKLKPGGSTIRSPLTGSDTDHAAFQASGIEKSVVDGCGSKFHTDLRESSLWSRISNIKQEWHHVPSSNICIKSQIGLKKYSE